MTDQSAGNAFIKKLHSDIVGNASAEDAVLDAGQDIVRLAKTFFSVGGFDRASRIA